jgi:hypothetical protein
MINEYRHTFKDELSWMLVICAVVAVCVCVLAVGTLTILFPFKTVERIPSTTCSTFVNCTTAKKLRKRIAPELRVIESSLRHIVSLNPKGGLVAKSLNPSRDDGSGMILIWMEYQKGFDGSDLMRNESF